MIVKVSEKGYHLSVENGLLITNRKCDWNDKCKHCIKR
jgi:hypothetical protein